MSSLLNWPVPNVAAKAVLFASLLLLRTAPFYTEDLYRGWHRVRRRAAIHMHGKNTVE
ncbi:hypothetical protein BCR43DRAFT_519498 [Syncephalastrum racemosum]|uniref:Uncharacterized protein n=1 Tax=Syncephalastrum racemosum TaxID=13706 RepID=A0A1X2GYT2_SYNRA|nr:hypothetical protein BCR43DRAFT_519497 [Syncephalastrum racemosum]ORY88523.1 hypothetical protein BCR43DRAFT_519498 [Syncephalastrum racemosum]